MTYPYQFIDPPQVIYRGKPGSLDEMKMDQLIQEHKPGNPFDVGLIGVPLSRSSISPSAASENPNTIRGIWRSFSTYNIDYDINLNRLKIADIGDIRMHITDILRCHQNIENGVVEILEANPSFLPVFIGGDHSITCPIVKGLKKFYGVQGMGRDGKIGILQFDTHFDLRDLKDGGPSNGTPIRGLIESGVIEGQHVVNIGLHGYFNTHSLKKYADENGVKYYTIREVRKQGIEQIISEAIQYLKEKVDFIYVTVDIDVLDIAFAPAAPASTPGGLTTWELFEAVYLAGKEEKVIGMDVVCLDPHRDLRNLATVKTGAHVILNSLCGYLSRK
ncbi:agmatinase family protein [Microaerobacter geothermalis]|uniref:agmatinase family protein n=1 Tax=Microaerobacter geothermalis TaxID=674972 RepID=UPI001F3DD89D|nr:agmatinase family protein [Microaerobacter geothermalis]MCF6093776.1 agmatinase family protein [Microaerobacter geothermalis]